ncbi:hypothetical protein [Spirosoma areae]
MKLLLSLLFITGCAVGQTPTKPIRRDSLPEVFPPHVDLPDLMPNARPTNSFYRNPRDPRNVVRATLDNMPIKVPDSSTYYTIRTPPNQRYRKNEPPQFLKPMPPVLPEKFKYNKNR